jgi:hypothetical protein
VAFFRCYFSIFNFEKIVPAIRICASSAAFEIAPIHTKPRPFVVCVGAFRWSADDWAAEHVRTTREPLARRLRIYYMFFYTRPLISARLSLHVRVASSVDTPRRHHRVLIFTLFMHRFRRPPRFPVEVVASFAPSLPPAAL